MTYENEEIDLNESAKCNPAEPYNVWRDPGFIRFECLRLVMQSNDMMSRCVSLKWDTIALAKRMADFVIDGTVTTKDTP